MDTIQNLPPFVQYYIITLVGIVGLIIGSFLNVVGLRLITEESIVFPASKCPNCNTTLKWYDNMPVIGYLLLLGKCRYCKKKISPQYPIVEAFTSFLFVSIFLAFGLTLKTLFLIILSCLLVVICITDYKEQLVYDVISYPIIPLGLIYNFFNIGNLPTTLVNIPLEGIGTSIALNDVFISAVIGAIAGAVFFELMARLGILMVGQRAFGEGDTFIIAGLGAFFGWKLTVVIIILSFLYQMLIGIPVIFMNMLKDKDYKSIIWLGILMFSMVIPKIGEYTGISNSLAGALLVTLITFTLAGIGVYVILQSAKERQNFTVMPFGPALIFGGFIVMFFGDAILTRLSLF